MKRSFEPRGLLFACLTVAEMGVFAPAPSRADPPGFDARLELSHLYSDDDQTERHLNYSQLRSTVDSSFSDFEFHLDGRGRLSWNEHRDTEEEISRLYLQYGHGDGFWLAGGRQTIASAASARVDGLHAGYRFSDEVAAGAFAGLMPHPWTGDVNADFATAGAGFELDDGGLQNSGGLVLQTYDWEMDRVYLTDRTYWRIDPEWSLFGFAVVEPRARRGVLADLGGVETAEQNDAQRVDLTNGQLMLRFRPDDVGDVSLRATHFHTVLPGVWWRHWLERERSRVGFTVDGEEPVGTRQSSVRLSGNLFASEVFIPHAEVRYDVRHSDRRTGYEARGGLKALLNDTDYADLSYAYRRHFVMDNHLLELQLGFDPVPALTVETFLAGMHSRPLDSDEGMLLFDGDVALWLNLVELSRTLEDFRFLVQYQAFVEPDLFYQVGHVRMVYHYRE